MLITEAKNVGNGLCAVPQHTPPFRSSSGEFAAASQFAQNSALFLCILRDGTVAVPYG